MAAAISALFKAANGLFHLTALEAVSSPGTSSHPMKPRTLHAWSRTEHNPGNWLRLCKIGPFCRASAVGCWESAVFCKLCLFSQGMKLFGFISLSVATRHLYREQFLLRSFRHSRTPTEWRGCDIHFTQ